MKLCDLNHILGGRVVILNADWEKIGDEPTISNFRFGDLWNREIKNIWASFDVDMADKYGVADLLYTQSARYTAVELKG